LQLTEIIENFSLVLRLQDSEFLNGDTSIIEKLLALILQQVQVTNRWMENLKIVTTDRRGYVF
jgi:hypothetical protein